MKQWRLDYPDKLLCRVLAVSRSGFYAWLKRPPCRRDQENEWLRVVIRAAHHKTRRTYSAKRLKTELGAEGIIALTIHPHPTLSETLGFAAEMAEGTITDLLPPKKR